MSLALVTIALNEAACIQRMLQSVESTFDEVIVGEEVEISVWS